MKTRGAYFSLHIFQYHLSAAYFSQPYSWCILYVCTFFHTPARRHKMYTQASPRRLLPAKSMHTTRTPAPPAGWLYQPPGFAFRAIKCIHYAARFSSVICISLPPSFLPSFLHFFSYFLKSAYTSRTLRQQGWKKKKCIH